MYNVHILIFVWFDHWWYVLLVLLLLLEPVIMHQKTKAPITAINWFICSLYAICPLASIQWMMFHKSKKCQIQFWTIKAAKLLDIPASLSLSPPHSGITNQLWFPKQIAFASRFCTNISIIRIYLPLISYVKFTYLPCSQKEILFGHRHI